MQNLKNIEVKLDASLSGKVRMLTDEYSIYSNIENKCENIVDHFAVPHGKKIYAVGFIHCNNCENEHTFVRKYLRIFRGVSKYNLQEPLDFLGFTRSFKNYWLKDLIYLGINYSYTQKLIKQNRMLQLIPT